LIRTSKIQNSAAKSKLIIQGHKKAPELNVKITQKPIVLYGLLRLLLQEK